MNTQTWLIAYDIRERRRLAAVHRLLRKNALAVQYSVFVGRFTRRGIRHLQAHIDTLIAPEDDVRLYPLPEQPDWVFYGRSPLPRAVYLLGQGLSGLPVDLNLTKPAEHHQPPAQAHDTKGGFRHR